VEIYEVTGAGPARTKLQAAVRRGLTRFVGRDAELEHLRRAQQVAGHSHGQVVAIVGEAGVGKSRLLYEFTHSHRLRGWLTLESASVFRGKTTSYLPVIDLLKGYFKIQNRDNLHEIREKVTGKLLSLDEALKPALPALLALLDAPVDDASWKALDPGQRRQQTLDAVKRLLLREAREQPLLLIFEDLHWIDSETQTLLDGLATSLGSARLLLLVTYRSAYQHTWGINSCYSQLRLEPLPTETTEELLEALLGDDHRLTPVKQLLVGRGNPFFLEETIRALVETKVLVGERGRYRLAQPIQALQIPPTVQATLAARIDQLAPENKRLLQVASVVGEHVPLVLLQAIADLRDEVLRGGLDHLQATDFLYPIGLYPDLEYSFKHALTHEVSYGSLLQEYRRELHARIVEAIETLYRNRLGEHIEQLAHHAVRGRLRERAVHYLRQAGLKAAARLALSDARSWFEQALGVLEGLPESVSTLEQAFEIRLELRPVMTQLGEPRRALKHLSEAETLAMKLNDDRRQGRVCAFISATHSMLGQLDEALTSGSRALEIAARLGDLRLRILTTSYLDLAHYYRGEYKRVVELATDNLAALPAAWVREYFGAAQPPSVYDRYWLALSLAELGRFAEAEAYGADAIRVAEPTQHAYTMGLANRAAGIPQLLKGVWATARLLIEREIALFRTGNVVLQLPWVVASSAWVLAQLGDTGEALNRLREGEQLPKSHAVRGIVGQRGWAYHGLGRACLLLGRLEKARRFGNRAVESSARQPGFAAHAQHLLGDIAVHPDRFDAESGDAHYRKALAVAELHGMRPLIAHCHLGLGKLYRRTGRRQEAQEHLATATTMYREMDMRFWLEQAEAEMRELAGC
jgi:tetratricopeptide (TPR) repeat protein